MASQLWDIILVALIGGAGNTNSSAGDSGVAVYAPPQTWDIQYWDGTNFVTGAGNTTSTASGVASVENANWYTITGTINTGAVGAGNTLSQSVDSGVTTKNPVAADGAANTLTQAADFAPFTILAPPSVTGFGNTVSSAYGSALRSFNTIGSDTDGGFDSDQHITESELLRPSARGDFVLDGLPLPS